MTEQFEAIHEPTLFAYWVLAEKAREKGVLVILTGTGGDEFCGGSLYVFSNLLRQGRVRDVRLQINQFSQTFAFDRRKLWFYFALLPLLPEPLRGVLRRIRWRSEERRVGKECRL